MVPSEVRSEKKVAEGTIKKLVSDRGFGFISQSDGSEIFFHRSKVTGGSFDSLTEGQKVSYEKVMDPRRNKENAEQVTPV
jgi:CspA family cold shock protein